MKTIKIAAVVILALMLGLSFDVADTKEFSCPLLFTCTGTTLDTCKDAAGNTLSDD